MPCRCRRAARARAEPRDRARRRTRRCLRREMGRRAEACRLLPRRPEAGCPAALLEGFSCPCCSVSPSLCDGRWRPDRWQESPSVGVRIQLPRRQALPASPPLRKAALPRGDRTVKTSAPFFYLERAGGGLADVMEKPLDPMKLCRVIRHLPEAASARRTATRNPRAAATRCAP